MGGGMAANLLAQGWAVRVHDIDASKVDALVMQGAVAAATPGECAAHAGITIVCVVDAQQTDDVLFGAGGVAAAVIA
eukprot:gene35175-43363_t